MKSKKTVFYILMFLPLLVTLVSLVFLPEKIPAHYGFDDQVTRWGSKYETLLFPVVTIFFGLFTLGISSSASKQEKTGKNNEKVCIVTGIVTLLMFNILTVYFLYTAFNHVENLSDVPVDLNQLVFILLGLCLIVFGNVMPKLRMNSLMGLRTHWSMKNEITWKKSQRFGGISFIAIGILIIAGCCFIKGSACFLWSMGLLILSLPIDVYYTYKVAKKY